MQSATPSFIGVPGPRGEFRHSLCISINEEVVHGIPGARRLREGDLVYAREGDIPVAIARIEGGAIRPVRVLNL